MVDKSPVGSGSDWEGIYEKEAPVLLGYLAKRVGLEQAEDVLQESFVRVMKMEAKNRKPDNIRAYLFQVARNLIIENHKKSSLVAPTDDTDIATTVSSEKQVFRQEVLSMLDRAVKNLKDNEKEVFQLRWHQGLKVSEIAQIIKKSERQVHRILDKVTISLKHYFKDQGWEAENVFSE